MTAGLGTKNTVRTVPQAPPRSTARALSPGCPRPCPPQSTAGLLPEPAPPQPFPAFDTRAPLIEACFQGGRFGSRARALLTHYCWALGAAAHGAGNSQTHGWISQGNRCCKSLGVKNLLEKVLFEGFGGKTSWIRSVRSDEMEASSLVTALRRTLRRRPQCPRQQI